MIVKQQYRKPNFIGVSSKLTSLQYRRMNGAGNFDLFKGLFSGGAKLLSKLFQSPFVQNMGRKLLKKGVDKSQELLKKGIEKGKELLINKTVDVVRKTGEDLYNKITPKPSKNVDKIVEAEVKKFSDKIIKNNVNKSVIPTLDESRVMVNKNLQEKRKPKTNYNNVLQGLGHKKGRNVNKKVMDMIGSGMVPYN